MRVSMPYNYPNNLNETGIDLRNIVDMANKETWEDLQFPVAAGKVPAVNTPSFETFTTNTKAYSFAVDDYIDLASQEPFHASKLRSNGTLHLHLATKAANATGSNRYAKFTAWVTFANINGVHTEQAPISAEYIIPTGTAALTHLFLDFPTEIDLSTMTNVGSQLTIRIKRIAATGGTEYAGNIFVTQCGMHIKNDTFGSTYDDSK